MNMTNKKQMEFLSTKLDSSIQKIKDKSKENKTKTAVINALSISLGALVTLTLGFEVADENVQIQKNAALLLGALLTIVNGWGAVFDYKKLWVRQKSTLLSLYQLQNELNFRKSVDEQSDVEDLFIQYQKIWEIDQNSWKSIVQASPKTHLSEPKESEK